MIANPVLPTIDLGVLIGNIVGAAIIIAGITTLIYILWGGLEWILSGGDKAGLESARNRIINAIIGLTLAVAAWAIMTLVANFLGFPFPSMPIPGLGENGAGGSQRLVKPISPSVKGAGEAGADCTAKGDSWCKSGICHYNKCAAGCSDFNQDPAACSSHYACYYKSACYWNQGEVCCLYR